MAQEISEMRTVKLPPPREESSMSVEAAIKGRRSERQFRKGALTLAELSQVLWAAQGSTGGTHRSVPSAGALYPLEIMAVVGEVEGLPAGVYRYHPGGHRLSLQVAGDKRRELASAAVEQRWIGEAQACLVIAAVYERTTSKYGERGHRYVHMEAGHAGQNVYLQAEALGLGTVMVGAFQDEQVRILLGLRRTERPLAIMPLGRL